MNRTHEHGSAMVLNAYIQESFDSQYETPYWRRPQASVRKPSFPPLDQIGSESTYMNRSRMAPPMDRMNNRSRSPMKSERRPQDYRSRSPFQQNASFDRPSQPQAYNPRPLFSGREESPPRFALRNGASPRPQQYRQEPHRRSPPQSNRLPYPVSDYSPQRPQLRVQPVSRPGPNPQEITRAVLSRSLEYASAPEIPRAIASRSLGYTTAPQIPRLSTGSNNSQTNTTTTASSPISEASQDDIPGDLIPKPLNLRKTAATRKEVTSMCEYLSLDELESLWQTQDLYIGLVNAPVKPCTPIHEMAPVGPMSPSLADHPAFRNEYRQHNNVACA